MQAITQFIGSRYLYPALVAVYALLAIAAVALKPSFNFAVSDGFFYYAYLPSLAIDGDLDFSNQIHDHGDPGLDPSWRETTRRGYAHNKYTVGFALTLAPAFYAAHALTKSLYAVTGADFFRPDGYTAVYQLGGLAAVLVLGLATFVLIEKLLTRKLGVPTPSARLAIVLYWTGSHYAYYYFREPFMVHVVSTFWVTCAIYLARTVVLDAPKSRRGALLIGLCASMAVLNRPTNAVLLTPFLIPLVRQRGFFGMLPLFLLGAAPILAQLSVWQIMHGSFLHYSYHSEGFNWLSPALISTLVSTKHGLFAWSPILFFALFGVVLAMRSAPPPYVRDTLIQLLAAFLLLWYVNSAWHNWWFGDAFGARAFLEVSLLFILGLAWFLQASAKCTPRVRWSLYTLLAGCWVFNYALMALYITRQIPRADYLL